jgi:hypothetical protein
MPKNGRALPPIVRALILTTALFIILAVAGLLLFRGG